MDLDTDLNTPPTPPFELWMQEAGDLFEVGRLAVHEERWPPGGLAGSPTIRTLVIQTGEGYGYRIPSTQMGFPADSAAVLHWALDSVNRRRQDAAYARAHPVEVPLLRQVARLFVRWASQ